MANFQGMDPDLVEGLSRDLNSQAGQIGAVITAVDRLVQNIPNIWKGKDSNDFIGWWRDQHRPHLNDLKGQLEGLSRSAHNNADEQRKASG